ncbi:putative dithiol-disulfide isomerase involved in polyketide biosynthesis [Thermoplasmatales archaeon BRNA1]|nr:putative dithiol-disulfide isomerase involved in polyketide biosynthesis [Thermoplasmatales archaeon BRNA1]
MKITYWTDFSCPFCYIGDTRLKNAIRSIGAEDLVEMELKSFQLTPQAGPKPRNDMVTGMAKHYGMSLSEAKERVDAISAMGAKEGLEFRYADVQSCNTFDAHRLMKMAFSHGKEEGERMALRLFQAFFGDCVLIADHDVLQGLAEECGFDGEEVREVLSSDRFADQVLADEREARGYGLNAVPFYIVGRYGVPGAPSTEEFAGLVKGELENSGELKKAPEGAVCGPDGCRIPGKD